MEMKCFLKGQATFRQGDLAGTMYDIEAGSVGIFAGYGTAEETQLASFGPGDTFGELEFIESCPRIASAVALEEVRAREITRDDFAGYFRDKPEKILAVMRQLSRRVRETTESYLDACRTVYETVETERAGETRSPRLKERLSFFHRIGLLSTK